MLKGKKEQTKQKQMQILNHKPIHSIHCKMAKGHEKGWQLNPRMKRSHKAVATSGPLNRLVEITYFKERTKNVQIKYIKTAVSPAFGGLYLSVSLLRAL